MGAEPGREVSRHVRTYRLCKLLGCPPAALATESAVQLDWLLQIDDVIRDVESNQEAPNA